MLLLPHVTTVEEEDILEVCNMAVLTLTDPNTLMALFLILKGACSPNQALTPLTFWQLLGWVQSMWSKLWNWYKPSQYEKL